MKTPSELYTAHRSALVAYATPILGSREAAEDVVHDAFVKFAPEGADGERGAGYLYRIVRNLALDVLKRRRIENRAQRVEPPDWTIPADAASPEQQTLLREDLRRLACALDTLPGEQRVALEMYRFDGCTLEQIATRLKVSVPTAHRYIRAALAFLAEALDAGCA